MMRFVSTRSSAPHVDFGAAIELGLAPDGGLYVPERIPLAGSAVSEDFVETAAGVIAPYLVGTELADRIETICERAFDFPLVIEDGFLELFHGPTAAFKDFGARFLAECLAALGGGPRTVLVATSGDTGGAVASAFSKLPGFRVVILFPKEGVSEFQRHQLTCWGDSVEALAVNGTFDDCQRLVKRAFGDSELNVAVGLTSANSINIGRLLPQAAYYAWASQRALEEAGRPCGFIVPSGNLGNGLAAIWARRMGYPISRIFLATNANQTVSDYFDSGSWSSRPSVSTLANAMDVGDPSNGERLLHLYPSLEELAAFCGSATYSDTKIVEGIRAAWREFGRIVCPHTATGVLGLQTIREGGDTGEWLIAATAHPSKFKETVDRILKSEGADPVEYPESLRLILTEKTMWTEIEPDFGELESRLRSNGSVVRR